MRLNNPHTFIVIYIYLVKKETETETKKGNDIKTQDKRACSIFRVIFDIVWGRAAGKFRLWLEFSIEFFRENFQVHRKN